MVDPDALDALGMAAAVRAGHVSSLELVDHAIARIEALDPGLNAVHLRRFDEARAAARQVRPGDARPFAGVPFLIKDHEVDVAGWPTWACGPYDDRPSTDSELVRRYRAAGLVLVGKTTLPELALMGYTVSGRFGITRNPWDRERNAGGSSGGAAVAVAARMVPAAHAADGGGSIRIPASACGVFGLKPSRGRVSVAPASEAWLGLCENHAVTRTVRDSAALLDVAAQPVAGDPWPLALPGQTFLDATKADPPPLRIAAFHGTIYGDELHPDCAAAVDAAAQLLARLGHGVERIDALGIDRGRMVEAYFIAVCASTSAIVDAIARRDRERDSRRGDVEPASWLTVRLGRAFRAREVARAFEVMQRAGRHLAAFHARYDVLLLATMAQPPQRLEDAQPTALERLAVGLFGRQPFEAPLRLILRRIGGKLLKPMPNTQLFNQTGQPAMSVPLFWNAAGLPIGVQFAARFGDEATLFSLAAQLERAQGWAHRRPPSM